MAEIEASTHIAAPPERVFDFIDHWPNAKRYLRRMVRWEPVDPDAGTGVGSVFHVGVQAGPTRLDGRLEVTEHARPQTIGFRSVDGPRVDGRWVLTPDDGGTYVLLAATYEVPGGIVGRMVSAFLSRNARNDLEASLAELKRLIESGS